MEHQDRISVPEARKVQMVVVKSEDEAKKIKVDIERGDITLYQAAQKFSLDPNAKHTLGEMGWVNHGTGFPELDEKNRLERARLALDKAKAKDDVASKKRTWNLGTSLKSYIDPRVLYEWGERVDYDVLERYYPKTLRRKFAWVREQEQQDDVQEDGAH